MSLRIFAVSDIHIDYEQNRRWLLNLSAVDYTEDILILAGDVTDIVPLCIEGFTALKKRFHTVVFIPGNHDLWVNRNNKEDSIAQFHALNTMAADYGILTAPRHSEGLSIVPLLGWYDYSFGAPSALLKRHWLDYYACRWPETMDDAAITRYFISMNTAHLGITNTVVLTFSHFLPRIDLMPSIIPEAKRFIYPVLGTTALEDQIRRLKLRIHVYGHSHVNMLRDIDGIRYINNAYGYPDETRIAAKQLLCIHET